MNRLISLHWRQFTWTSLWGVSNLWLTWSRGLSGPPGWAYLGLFFFYRCLNSTLAPPAQRQRNSVSVDWTNQHLQKGFKSTEPPPYLILIYCLLQIHKMSWMKCLRINNCLTTIETSLFGHGRITVLLSSRAQFFFWAPFGHLHLQSCIVLYYISYLFQWSRVG